MQPSTGIDAEPQLSLTITVAAHRLISNDTEIAHQEFITSKSTKKAGRTYSRLHRPRAGRRREAKRSWTKDNRHSLSGSKADRRGSKASDRRVKKNRAYGRIQHGRWQEICDAKKIGNKCIDRLGVELIGRANLTDAPRLKDGYSVGNRKGFLLIMGNEDGRLPEGSLNFLEFGAHPDAQLRVQIRKRLVEKKDVRFDYERPRESDALLLAARELER